MVSDRSDDLTGRALPESPEVPIIVLSPVKVRELADESGDFGYLEISPVEISADTAKLGISHTVAVSRSRGPGFHTGNGLVLGRDQSPGALVLLRDPNNA